MTRFEEVARLRELEKKAEPGWLRGDMGSIYCEKSPDKYPLLTPYGINSSAPEVQIAVDLRNAAPWLLEAAACFQPGYAALLKEIVWAMDTYFQDSHYRPHKIAMGELVKAAEIMEELE